MKSRQAEGGARGRCGPRSNGRDISLFAVRAAISSKTIDGATLTASGGGPATDCTQHCIPQPAAQAEPES
jgi:hypothetical protein